MRHYKKPSESDVELSAVMHPEDTNVAGNIFGGKILALMDQAAYACACKHARMPVVTASVNTVNFRTPIYVGDLVTIKARVNYAGNTSMMIGIRVEAENLITGEIRHSNSSYFTMVAKIKDGDVKKVPGLILETRDDVRRFIRSINRRQKLQEYLKDFGNKSFRLSKEYLDLCKQHHVLLNENLYNILE